MPTVSDWAPVRTDHIFAGITNNGRVVVDVRDAAATMDDVPADFLKGVSALYGFDTIAAANVGLTRLTTVRGPLADVNGGAILGVGVMGTFDDTAVVTAENNFGALRMTTTRILLNVIADPTTPTQRARVLAAAATQDETATQYATVAAALYSFGGVDLDRLRAQGTDADNVAVLTAGAQVTASHGYLFDAAAVNWDRALGVGGAAVVTGPLVDDAAFTPAVDRVFPIGAFADDTAPDSVDENDIGVPRMTISRVLNTIATDQTTITSRQAVLAAAATYSEVTAQYATVAAVLYGFNPVAGAGVAMTRLQTVQGPSADATGAAILAAGLMATFDDAGPPTVTAENNFGTLRMTTTRCLLNVIADPTTPTQRARVLAATQTQDETATQYATVAAALYVWDGTDLQRTSATDQDTGAGTDFALDVALMVATAGGGTQLGAIDDAAVVAAAALLPTGAVADPTDGAVDANDVGFMRMTLSRVLQAVVSDPTTPATQRQRVLAAAATQDETVTQYATAAVALYGFDTAAVAGSALTRLTTVRGPLADVTGAAILGLGMMATFDDAGPPTVTTENSFGTVRMTTRRVLMGVITDPVTPTQQALVLAAGADAEANTDDSLLTSSWDMRFNNTTWDRTRNNHEVTALASAARVATTQSAELTNYDGRGVALLLDVTAVGAPAGQINSIEVQVPIGANWDTIYQFAAINIAAVGRRFFLIYPGAASAGSWSQVPFQGILPRRWRVQTTHNAADSITYSLTASYVN